MTARRAPDWPVATSRELAAKPTNAEIVSDLRHATATFQLRTIAMVIGLSPNGAPSHCRICGDCHERHEKCSAA
jgi:hypothetical protein